ncbi:MAG: HNH endonuclease, partial [Bacteroidota bacterium]
LTQIDKPIKETLEDAQGRLTFVLNRPGQSNKVVSVHPASDGQFKTTTYSPSYNPDLNPDIPVPLSKNRLTPDYNTTNYMHPDNKGLTVRIELSGNRNLDFTRSRDKLKELLELDATDVIDETGYTWHHLDDFEIVGDKAYSTMQLVESSAHQGTGVLGMQHSGSAAQWRAYFGSGY